MGLIIKNNDYTLCLPPKGKHMARCFGVIDLGMQKNYGGYSPKVLIAWELSHLLMMCNKKPFTIMQQYTANLHPQSKLKTLLEAWRGQKFDLEELYGFHLENMLGKSCYLTIDHIMNSDRQKYLAKVINIAPLPLCIPCPNLHNTPIYFDLDYHTEKNYLAVPENIRKKINVGKIANQPSFIVHVFKN